MGLAKQELDRFRTSIKGRVVRPEDPDYDQVRKIWNAMIDRRPAAIVQCADSSDVQRAIAFASESRLDLTIRGAGHNIAGNSISENGLMIDLSTLRKVTVDPNKRRAVVHPGATLGDLDAATQTHGLAVPVGINSTTGIAGLTL